MEFASTTRFDSEAANVVSAYMRDLAVEPLMSPTEEREAATRIAALRRSYWESLLAYPPFVAGITAVALEHLTIPEETKALIERTVKAARALRDRNLTRNREAFEKARLELAGQLAAIDLDRVVADRVLADLSAMVSGSEGAVISLSVRKPPRRSKPFELYVARAQRHSQLLWAAKSAFVKANLRLVVTLVRRLGRGRLPLTDLIQEGNIGLMKAVDRFDAGKGVRFSTYAAWWIRHSVTRAIADKSRTIRIPVHMIELRNKVRRAQREFERTHGRVPTQDEVAEAIGVKSKRVAQLHRYVLESPVSLDRAPGSDDYSLMEQLADSEAERPDEFMVDHEVLTRLHELLDELSPVEADVLRKRVGIGAEKGMTLREIGEEYSLSRERIRQIQGKALATLRERIQEQFGGNPLQLSA